MNLCGTSRTIILRPGTHYTRDHHEKIFSFFIFMFYSFKRNSILCNICIFIFAFFNLRIFFSTFFHFLPVQPAKTTSNPITFLSSYFTHAVWASENSYLHRGNIWMINKAVSMANLAQGSRMIIKSMARLHRVTKYFSANIPIGFTLVYCISLLERALFL